jgi:putative transposase
MKKKYTEEQIISAVKRLERGETARELSRELGVTTSSLYVWRRKFGGMEVSDAKRMRALEHENARLKRVVADMTLDIQILKEVNSKKW